MRHLVWIVTLSLAACSGSVNEEEAPATQAAAPTEISITSKSPEAIERFNQGRDLLENVRPVEAAEQFREALKLDSDFALARAYLGLATPGAEGLQELERAAGQTAGLPETERLLIEAVLADRRGELARSTERWRQLAGLVPKDWRAQWGLGQRLFADRKDAEAAEAFEKVTALNPTAGAALNSLGYAQVRARNADRAIEAFNRYVSAAPGEPNAQDSLGEGLMAAGRFADAEAAFRKAAELSPRFWNAWEGVAYSKFYAGDWAAGREALAKAREMTSRPTDRVAVDTVLAWSRLAEGNLAEALKQFDAVEKTAEAQPSDVAVIPIGRALALSDAGRQKDAIAQVSKALENAKAGQLPPRVTRTVNHLGLATRATAEARMGDAAAVEKTVAELEQLATASPDDPFVQSSLHLAQGMLAVAKRDLASARTHFGQCLSDDSYCHWQEVAVSEKAGDRAAADAARKQLLAIYLRDPISLYVRSKLDRPRMTS